MTAPATALEARLREVLKQRSMLAHPFYRAWSEGRLPVEGLQEYARQYFHFEAAFPRYLSAIHTRTESPAIRQVLLDNLWDEEHGERNHTALWLDFAAALGVPREDVLASVPNSSTAVLLEHFDDVCRNGDIAEALATLFAYEGQVPEIAWEKIKGLKDHYGFSPSEFEFFSVHLISDVAHAGSEMAAIAEAATNDDAVVEAASDACDRLLGFLDGCYGAV